MAGVNKTHLTETDIITKFILPAITDAGWDIHAQMGLLIESAEFSQRSHLKKISVVWA